ncbi:cytochrome p450 [Moniliophthora roreri MCA 2997]|uniref:Cytochrome p450 n=1 Tax=Moniliophthora roreri (strain MCA 2997) TaxID=1381753 RepID=V2X6W1_MONRO|nr:cytochrome p450 [Moniliophthora roreri MCA 2997]
MARVTKKDFRFSDGSLVPAGTNVGAATHHIYHDEATYPVPDDFNAARDPWNREARMVYTLTTCELDQSPTLLFSSGRFFAVHELKAMLAHS